MLPEREQAGVLLYGRADPPPQRRELRAGPLSMIWEEGDLRYIRLGEHEVLRRVYIAIRDRNWGTAPNVLSNLVIDAGEDCFRISFDVDNQINEIAFTWRGEIVGESDGTLCFVMDGIAQSTFMKNRIGFCILHPDDIAGAKAVVEHVDGTVEKGALPQLFTPDQPVQPFAEMRRLSHQVAPGAWADLLMEGDIFEMEDQRNWTDASYKTFCTPLRIPYPVEVTAGTRVRQALTLTVRQETAAAAAPQPAAVAAGPAPVTFALDLAAPPVRLPQLGLGVASDGAPLTPREIERLSALRLRHLRVDLVLGDPQFPARLRQASEEAARIGALLEIALFVDPANAAAEAAALAPALGCGPQVIRWLAFPTREQFKGGTPLREVLEAVRPVIHQFRPDPVYSGTNTDYIFLARSVPPPELVDGITFAITPQVHAFDNASLVETLGTQGQAVASARALMRDAPAQGKPVCVSPVTLKMRHNPYATGAIPPTPPGELPPQVDPRQMSLFAAGWTAASIKHLAEAGADSITYFETAGWRGVMERAGGSPAPDRFPSLPGAVFPVYHVLASIAECETGLVIPSRSSERLKVDGLALRRGDGVRLLLANLTADPQTVALPLSEAAVRQLDASNAERAMLEPEAFRAAGAERMDAGAEGLTLKLSPYAVAFVDATLRRDPSPEGR